MINKTDDFSKININKLSDEKLTHKFGSVKKLIPAKLLGGAFGIILLGILSGFLLFSLQKKTLNNNLQTGSSPQTKVVGSKDQKTFKDSAEGTLEAGGVNGEGTHRLIRPGGESQTVYLTSSVLNMDDFVGKKVRVWGETFAAKKAGWLMDVGKVEVLE